MAKQTKKYNVLVVARGSAGVASARGADRNEAKIVIDEKTDL